MIIRKKTTESTNSDAKEFAMPLHGTTIVATAQTCGRGRMSREFFSPSGGLYVSIILTKLPKDCSIITCGVAVVLARAIEDIYGKKCQLKWVNDLFFEGKKVAGILCESVALQGELERVVVGIGVNTVCQEVPANLKDIVGTLEGRDEQREALLDRLAKDIPSFDFDDKESFVGEYKDRCFLIGRDIYVGCESKYRAKVIDIDSECGLVVKSYESGEVHTLRTGEVITI